MYKDENFDQSNIMKKIVDISNKRDELEHEHKLDENKERELFLRQFYQGLKLCTRNNYFFNY